ncbi:hypothetical protein BC834DRAFT_831816 [Gloeopeniophorella convolvens]|nr:hypothetical protein BC834DRAFT_831816 [Gloeopeniophorella convolvens]
MARYTLSALVALASSVYVAAQDSAPTFPPTPLNQLQFPYPTGIPEKVFPGQFARGTQSGFNICNATTETQTSDCQTGFIDHIDDFCLWGPPTPNQTIGDSEAIEVVWCTKKGHGTRLIPSGTLTGVQFLLTTEYIQVVGFLDQTKINIQYGDPGGELDSGGQDQLGNAIGALMYTNAFPIGNTDNNTYEQILSWTYFMGGNAFCAKICRQGGTNPAGYCQHTLDRIGCTYNAPNNAQNGTFEVCDSDLMDIPGVYTVNGQTLSYSQPAETVPIGTLPYTPRIPASSNCVSYASSALYTDLVAAPTSSSTSSSAAPTSTGKSGANPSSTGSKSSSASGSSPTGGSSNGSSALTVSLFSGILGVAFSVAFLA